MSNLGDILDGFRRERWEGEGLVGNFKLQLEERSIEIVSKRGNSFCLRKGDTAILLSAHEYTPKTLATEGKGWWAVSQNFIEGAEAGAAEFPWGVVFLLGNSTGESWIGYWLSGADFEEVDPGAPDSDGKRHIYLEKLEKVAERFYSVKEFCSLVDI
ncbi:MAG: hypothetical protein AAB433_12125 [Nitrospirota bacterium]